MSEYVMRVTIFVPEAMIDDANQLALCLGQSAADVQTFKPAAWKDAGDNRYSVSSTLAKATFPEAAAAALSAPAFAPDADLTAAERAQAALVIHDPQSPVQADPSRILAVINDDAQAAVAIAGVAPLPVEGGA
jgi:hypothetical protein